MTTNSSLASCIVSTSLGRTGFDSLPSGIEKMGEFARLLAMDCRIPIAFLCRSFDPAMGDKPSRGWLDSHRLRSIARRCEFGHRDCQDSEV